jgi:hypothetical protein
MKERSIEDLEADQRSRHEQMRRIDCTDEQAAEWLKRRDQTLAQTIDRENIVWKVAFGFAQVSCGSSPLEAEAYADYVMARPEHHHGRHDEIWPHFEQHQRARHYVMNGASGS